MCLMILRVNLLLVNNDAYLSKFCTRQKTQQSFVHN